jgi:hypothetical protein
MKNLAAFLLCCFQGLAFAQDMPPLKSWVDQHPQWRDNKTELAYLSNRCASAFDLVGNHFAVHAALDEQLRSANIFLNHSDTYVRIGYFLTIKQGFSETQALENYNFINSTYAKWMKDNLANTGDVMQAPLSDDVELCLLHYRAVQIMARELELEFATNKPATPDMIQNVDKKLDMAVLQIIWTFIKTETAGPSDFPMPQVVVDATLPLNARMVFQYPSNDQPNNTLQIGVSPRTLSAWSRGMVSWAAGHELTHYAFLMRDNGWVRQDTYQSNTKHHCNPDFIRLTTAIADLISDELTNGKDRLRMYSEVFRSCSRHPEQ